MSPCVLDASVALAFSFDDEASPYTDRVIDSLKYERATVPLIWPLEINNALLIAIRRQRMREREVFRLLGVIDSWPLDIDHWFALGDLGQTILTFGVRYGLSAYDASYLELALRVGLPLATQDEKLARAAQSSGVPLFNP